MYRLNPDCWVWSPRTPLCLLSQHSGSIASTVLSHQEEEEEEEKEEEEERGEHPSVCCCVTGGGDVISQAADTQWATSKPATHSGIPGCSDSERRASGASSSQLPKTVIDADGGGVSQRFLGDHCWDGRSQGCVCVYGQREPEGLGPCWPGSPYVYYGVRRNLVVGVEMVEEVSVEDTLEVITEDIYADDLLSPELQRDTQPLYPT